MKKLQITKRLTALLWALVLTLMPMSLMADNNTPLSVTVINTGGGIGDQYGEKAFDGKLETKWCGDITSVTLPFVEVQLAEPSKLDYYYLYTGNDINYYEDETSVQQMRNPKEWKLYAKVNEGDEWTLISHVTDAGLPTTVSTRSNNYKIDAAYQNIEYNYFRFEILGIELGNIYEIGEICLINCAHEYAEGSAICNNCGTPCSHENHDELIPAKESTCNVAGNIAYYQCADCHKYFDEEGNELAEGAWLLPTVEHNYVNGVCAYSYSSECNAPYLAPEGEGTEQSPYLIANAGNLAWYRNLTRNGVQNKYAKMTADIDMNAVCNETIGSWRGIDNFAGTFDGDGHVLTNLYINDSNPRAGFFHQNTGVIKNLGIESGIVKNSGDVVGAICADNLKFDGKIGRIINCFNKANVHSSYHYNMTPDAGGICGENSGYIERCYNYGNVSGYDYIGGICGFINQGTITDCYNAGNISGQSNKIGGICGYAINYANANLPTIIKNCHNIGIVTASATGGIAKSIIGERGFGGKNIFSITNNYYLEDLNADEYATAMTEEQFESGEVTWLLNGSVDGEGNWTAGKTDGTQAWYQSIDSQLFPSLQKEKGNTVFSDCANVTHKYNNSGMIHNFGEDLVCTVCGHEIDDDYIIEYTATEKLNIVIVVPSGLEIPNEYDYTDNFPLPLLEEFKDFENWGEYFFGASPIKHEYDEATQKGRIICNAPVTQFDYFTDLRRDRLTSITLPSTVEWINGRAFYDCRNLTSITLLAEYSDKLEYHLDLEGCNNLQEIVVPYNSYADYVEAYKDVYCTYDEEDGMRVQVHTTDYITSPISLDDTKEFQMPTSEIHVNATLQRTFSNDGWYSLCLPFSVFVQNTPFSQVAEFCGVEGDTYKFKTIDFFMIDAGKPYIVKVDAEVKNPTFKNVYLTTVAPATDGDFIGVYSPTELGAGCKVIGSGTTVNPADPGTMNGFRAYFPASAAAAKAMRFTVDGGEATDIQSLTEAEGNKLKAEGTFNLAGQKVDENYRGIVIKNGKKVLVK